MQAVINKISKTIIAAILFVSIALPVQAAQNNGNPSLQEMAERAYLYGLQQAIFYGQRWIYTQNKAKSNES